MNILILDDEPKAARMLTETVREAAPGTTIHTYTDFAAAIAAAEKRMPEIAFLDIEVGPHSGLEAAKALKAINPKINVVFVTAYSNYAVESIALHPSGYLLKPASVEDVRGALENLLYPREAWSTGIYARTFGNFDLYVNGKPVSFTLSKAKEMLAYLIDRNGAAVNRKELAGILFEDQEYNRAKQNYLSKVYKALDEALREAGAPQILKKGPNQYYVSTEVLRCDLWDYRQGLPEGINAFRGEYMSQYAWAEPVTAELNQSHKRA